MRPGQSHLFRPLTLGDITLQNRIVVAPMCQYSAVDGCATAWHTVHLGNLALSGAGLLLLEATAVTPEGRISPFDLGLYSEANEMALAATLAVVRANSTMPIGVQLAHAGRKASTSRPWDGGTWVGVDQGGWQPVAPSALSHDGSSKQAALPRSLTQVEIAEVVAAFAAAARRAACLGLDTIEIHAAHGYLLHQFLSPLSNQRNDEYGGSLANRLRLTLQVFRTVREAFPSGKPVGVRVSATDWADGGWDLAQTLELAKALEELGCSFLHVSSGGLVAHQKIPVGPNYQVPFARAVRAATKLPTIAVGMITEPLQAEAIVATGDADMVALARGMLYDPRWPWHAAAALGASVAVPPQFHRSQPAAFPNLFAPPAKF